MTEKIFLIQVSWGQESEHYGYSFCASVLPQVFEDRQEAENAAKKASKYRDAKVIEVDLREKKVHASFSVCPAIQS